MLNKCIDCSNRYRQHQQQRNCHTVLGLSDDSYGRAVKLYKFLSKPSGVICIWDAVLASSLGGHHTIHRGSPAQDPFSFSGTRAMAKSDT